MPLPRTEEDYGSRPALGGLKATRVCAAPASSQRSVKLYLFHMTTKYIIICIQGFVCTQIFLCINTELLYEIAVYIGHYCSWPYLKSIRDQNRIGIWSFLTITKN